MNAESNDANFKRMVARSFDRAAVSYDAYAGFQEDVLQQLRCHLPARKESLILDLGSGTGNAFSFLDPRGPLVSMDLSLGMLKQADQKQCAKWLVCGDAESLPFAQNSFSLVFSSLAVQWCRDPNKLFSSIHSVLRNNGYWLFSTLCQGSMPELEDCWKKLDRQSHINHYPTFSQIKTQLKNAGLILEYGSLEKKTMWFDSPLSAIHSLKKIGASVVIERDRQKAVSPAMWRKFVLEYEQTRQAQGVPLSYEVAYFLAKKQ